MQESEIKGKYAQASGGPGPTGTGFWSVKTIFWIILVFATGYAIASVVYVRIVGLHLTEGELLAKYWYIYASYCLLFGVVMGFAHLMERERDNDG